MNMDEKKYIDLYSQARLNGYSSTQEHEQNFQMLDKIASKLSRIEIIIRNRVDRKMCESNKDWLFNLPDDIRLDVGDKTQDHDTLVSRQTFGFWIKVVRYYEIEECAFKKEFLSNYSFKKYYAKNTEKTNKEYLFSWQIASMILQLTKNIRNRAFHLENLLKIQKNGLPRLSAKVDFENNDFAIKRINPNKLITFLDDILKGFEINLVE